MNLPVGANLFCTKCGAQNPDDADFCHQCGQLLFRPGLKPSDASAAPQQATSESAAPVDGEPLLATPDNGQSVNAPASANPPQDDLVENHAESEAERIRREHPNLVGIGGWLLFFCIAATILSPLVAVVGALAKPDSITLLGLGIAAFSIFAGVKLWKIDPKAITYVKFLLWAQLCFGAIFLLVQFINAVDLESAHPGSSHPDSTGLRMMVGAIIWLWYFSKSKRVKATFGRSSSSVNKIQEATLASGPVEKIQKTTADTASSADVGDLHKQQSRITESHVAAGLPVSPPEVQAQSAAPVKNWEPSEKGAICLLVLFAVGFLIWAAATQQPQTQQQATTISGSSTSQPSPTSATADAPSATPTPKSSTNPLNEASDCPSAIPAGIKSLPLSPAETKKIVGDKADLDSNYWEGTENDMLSDRLPWDAKLSFSNNSTHCITRAEVELTLQYGGSTIKERHTVSFNPVLGVSLIDNMLNSANVVSIPLRQRTKENGEPLGIQEWHVTKVWGFDYHSQSGQQVSTAER